MAEASFSNYTSVKKEVTDKIRADVSIVAANYNNGKFLSAFIDSIVQSTMLPKELILVDDGSTDDSRTILKQFAHLDWLSCIFLGKNEGLTFALNAALDRATGKYIMRADPDDIFLPDRIEKQISFLENHPEIDVLGCNVTYFRSPGITELNQSNFPIRHNGIADRIRHGEHGIQHPTAVVRASVFSKYRYQPLFPGEDYELFARMLQGGAQFANLKKSYYLMRIHTGSSTSNLKKEHIERTFRFRDQIFKTKTSPWHIWLYFQHIRLYRKYQLSSNVVFRHFYLAGGLVLYPSKMGERMMHWISKSGDSE